MTATLETRSGRNVLRFERQLAHPPEHVWRALVDDDELAHWFPARIDGPREPGAKIRYAWHPPGRGAPVDDELAAKMAGMQGATREEEMTGEIRVFDPPRTLELTWHTEVLRFELTPQAGGTRLVFTHVFDDRSIAIGAAAGWHACFDALARRVAGEPPVVLTARWIEATEAAYRSTLGA